MPFAQKGPTPLGIVLSVRLTAEEKETIALEARASGLSMTEYSKKRIFGRKVRAKTDVAMLNEIRRIGGLIKHVHTVSGGINADLSAKTLRKLTEFIERMEAEKK